jgi:hypothetical protein
VVRDANGEIVEIEAVDGDELEELSQAEDDGPLLRSENT